MIVAAGVLIAEVLSLPQFAGASGREAALTFGAMLISLSAVVASVILPERVARAALGAGAIGFFVGLAYATINSVRF